MVFVAWGNHCYISRHHRITGTHQRVVYVDQRSHEFKFLATRFGAAANRFERADLYSKC